MLLSPADIPQPDRYKLLIGLIVPRPIALVSTVSPAGKTNLAPFSFFAGVGSNPMTLLFCPANKDDGSDKDSLRNAALPADHGCGEFVVNIVSEDIARRMAACAEPLAYGDSEFDLSGLTPAPCDAVRPPRVLESPASFECRTLQVIRTNRGEPGGGNVVLGEILRVHVRDDIVNQRLHADPAKLNAVGRMGGLAYVRTADAAQRFELPMGRKALT